MQETIKEKIILKSDIDKSYKKGNIQKAIELCQSALLKDPTDADLHIKLGDLYLEWHLDIFQARQYIDEAITEYQRALETHINSGEVYFKIGNANYYKNDLDKAVNYFKLALEHNYNKAESAYMLAASFMKKALFLDALEFAHESLKYKKYFNASAHFLVYRIMKLTSQKTFVNNLKMIKEFLLAALTFLFDKKAIKALSEFFITLKFFPALIDGMIKANSQSLEAALQVYQRTIEQAPGFVMLYTFIGDIYRAMGQYDDAINEYNMAIWLDSLNIPAYRSLCQTYEEQGDYQSACNSYKKLIEIQPNVAEHHSNLANILYLSGDVQQAVVHYQNAIILNPRPAWTSVIAQTLGFVFHEDGRNLNAAVSCYQTASMLTPTDIDIYVNLGSVFYDQNEFDSALVIYRKALLLNPKDAKIHCNLGYLHWGKGDIEEAIKEYELAIKYDPDYDIAYNNLGVIYLDDLGRIQLAIDAFQKAVDLNPNYALAHFNLGRSVSIKGEKIAAAKHYQDALDINKVTKEIDPQEILDKLQGLFE